MADAGHVQTKGHSLATNLPFPDSFYNSISVTLDAAVSIGDLLVVQTRVDYQGGVWGVSCADSLGNTYTQINGFNSGFNAQRFGAFYTVVTNAGTPTITASYTELEAWPWILAHHRNDTTNDPFLDYAQQDQDVGAASPVTTGNIGTLATENAVLVSFAATADGNQGPLAGAGFEDLGSYLNYEGLAAENVARVETKHLSSTSPASADYTSVPASRLAPFVAAFRKKTFNAVAWLRA